MSRPVDLAIFDFDNTLTDSVAIWVGGAIPCIKTLENALNRDQDHILSLMRLTPKQFLFSDIGAAVEWLDRNGHLPPAATLQEQYQRRVLKDHIHYRWKRREKDLTVFYPGVMETLTHLKNNKTPAVINTDAEATTLIRRLWFAARNATRDNPSLDPHDILDLFSHFYAQPSNDRDEQYLHHLDLSFVLKMKQKMTIWHKQDRKPCPDHSLIICNDHSTLPSRAIMVGDNHKDGGCARPVGMDFVWFEGGTIHDPEGLDIVEKICDPGHPVGTASIRSRFDEDCFPHHSMIDFSDLISLYDYRPGSPCRESEDPACRAFRMSRTFDAPGKNPSTGPCTFIPKSP
jgi:phosphoglycolate phosphatase-like HAD superfamily hydrolase